VARKSGNGAKPARKPCETRGDALRVSFMSSDQTHDANELARILELFAGDGLREIEEGIHSVLDGMWVHLPGTRPLTTQLILRTQRTCFRPGFQSLPDSWLALILCLSFKGS
jgi:hypothetical protein